MRRWRSLSAFASCRSYQKPLRRVRCFWDGDIWQHRKAFLGAVPQKLTQNLTHVGPKIGENPLFALASLRRRHCVADFSGFRAHPHSTQNAVSSDVPVRVGPGAPSSYTIQNSPSTGACIGLEWGEMLRTGIAPETCEMTAERLSCWPPESRTGFGHRQDLIKP